MSINDPYTAEKVDEYVRTRANIIENILDDIIADNAHAGHLTQVMPGSASTAIRVTKDAS